MADIKNDAVKEPKTQTPEHKETKVKENDMAPTQKISLVEMIMILMLVGLIFVFVFPFKQMSVDKEKESIARLKFEEILPTFDRIVEAAEEYKKTDEFAAYPIILDELNLTDINTENFKFEYTDQGPTITAVSLESFGKANVKVSYNMSTKSFSIEDAKASELPTVKDDWLP